MNLNKDIWIVTVATLSLVVSVLVPYASRKYDQWKAKVSFDLYLKKYLGVVYNILTYDKLEYHLPSIKDNPEKLLLTLSDYIDRFVNDFKEHQYTLQPRIGFPLLLNLQYLLMTMHRIQRAVDDANVSKLYEQTLSHGNNLSRSELNKIYAILLMMEHFGSIIAFHDRFREMKVVKRLMKEGQWVSMQVDGELLKSQHLISEDLKYLCNQETSIEEIIKMSQLMVQEFKSFYKNADLTVKKKFTSKSHV